MAEKKSKLAVIKTKPTTASVDDFINALPDEQKIVHGRAPLSDHDRVGLFPLRGYRDRPDSARMSPWDKCR